VTGQVFELEGGRITIEQDWQMGATVDRGARWSAADVGDAVRALLAEQRPARAVWGT